VGVADFSCPRHAPVVSICLALITFVAFSSSPVSFPLQPHHLAAGHDESKRLHSDDTTQIVIHPSIHLSIPTTRIYPLSSQEDLYISNILDHE
jgi:hypothetical protein